MSTIRKRDFSETHTVTLEIDGADPRPQPYSRVSRVYVPDLLTIEYHRSNGGGWNVSVSMEGAVLKRDGTIGANRTDEHLYRSDAMPVWVQDTVTANTPGGAG